MKIIVKQRWLHLLVKVDVRVYRCDSLYTHAVLDYIGLIIKVVSVCENRYLGYVGLKPCISTKFGCLSV